MLTCKDFWSAYAFGVLVCTVVYILVFLPTCC
jgi:hypothetical protein